MLLAMSDPVALTFLITTTPVAAIVAMCLYRPRPRPNQEETQSRER